LLSGNEFTLNFSTYLQCSAKPHLYSDIKSSQTSKW